MRPMPPHRWEQIKQLYEAALGREPQARSAFLAEACAGDPALLREVESLLQSNEQVGSFLSATSLKEAARAAGEWLGRRIGAYKLIREIGRGGMGTVYLASRADELFNKLVAVKLINRGMDTESILRRFENERRILAALEHPSIARLLDGGTTDDGLPYFVMEYVDGRPLYEYCDSHQLSVDERLKLFEKICSAVQYAHRQLIVHRDLKPKNILVTTDGTAKLLDFGIAKFLRPELASHTIDPTAPAARLMTPEYASPEQVRGEPITAASDIYSLGVLLYGLLTGHRPYLLKSRFPHELSRIICEEEPTAPSAIVSRVEPADDPEAASSTPITPQWVSKARHASPEQLRRRLRGDLDNIVLKAMNKAPKARYASAEELSEDIRRHLEGRPIIAHEPAVTYRIAKMVRRQRTAVIASGLALLALAAAGAAIWQVRARPTALADKVVKSLVVLPFVNSAADPNAEYFSDGVTESLINSLSRLPQLRVMARWTSFRFKGLPVDPQRIARQLNVDAVLSGSAVQRGDALVIQVELVRGADGVQLWGDHYHRPLEEVFAMQEEIAKAIADKLSFKLTSEQQRRVSRRETENQEAYRAYLRGRYFWNKRTKEGINAAIEHFQSAIELDPSYASAHAGLANAYAVLPSYDPLAATSSYDKGEAAARAALQVDDAVSDAWAALGWIKFSRDLDLPAAGQHFAHALELNPSDATAHQWRAFYLSALGRFDEAFAELNRAVELDPLSPIINNTLGRTLYYARRYPEAIEQFRKTLELEPAFPAAHYNLGAAYAQSGDYSQAIVQWRHGDGLSWIARRAYAAALVGDKREALAALERLKEASGERDIPALIALIHLGLGDKQAALDWLERAYQARDVWLLFFKVEPEFDAVRSDPRFEELLRRLKLEA